MNTAETKKIKTLLKRKFGASNFREEGHRLHHCTIKQDLLKKGVDYFDINKTRHRLSLEDFLVHYEAGINKAGVGDGKLPAVALTYSIDINLHFNSKQFRAREYNEYQNYFGLYVYARSLSELETKLDAKFSELINKLEQLKRK